MSENTTPLSKLAEAIKLLKEELAPEPAEAPAAPAAPAQPEEKAFSKEELLAYLDAETTKAEEEATSAPETAKLRLAALAALVATAAKHDWTTEAQIKATPFVAPEAPAAAPAPAPATKAEPQVDERAARIDQLLAEFNAESAQDPAPAAAPAAEEQDKGEWPSDMAKADAEPLTWGRDGEKPAQ
jgi:hypothetical protein